MGRKKKGDYKLSDPVLRAIRKARIERDEAESHYAELLINAIKEQGYSYAVVAEAAMTDKGSLHYYIHRTIDRVRVQRQRGKEHGRKYVPPAKVDV